MEGLYDRQSSLDIRLPRKVGVIGLGETGSWMAFNLALSGVEELVLIDPDALERDEIYQSPFFLEQEGCLKVVAMGELIGNRRLDCLVIPFADTFQSVQEVIPQNLELLVDCSGRLGVKQNLHQRWHDRYIRLGYQSGCFIIDRTAGCRYREMMERSRIRVGSAIRPLFTGLMLSNLLLNAIAAGIDIPRQILRFSFVDIFRCLFGLDDQWLELGTGPRQLRKVAVFGAGGIGSWVAMILGLTVQPALQRCEKLILADPDTLETTNLNRTPYLLDNVGEMKVKALGRIIDNRRPDLWVKQYPFSAQTAESILPQDILVIDCCDVATVKEELSDRYPGSYYKLGYDGFSLSVDADYEFRPWMVGPIGYGTVPSYLGTPQFLAAFLINSLCCGLKVPKQAVSTSIYQVIEELFAMGLPEWVDVGPVSESSLKGVAGRKDVLVAVGSSGALLRSGDGGLTWEDFEANTDLRGINFTAVGYHESEGFMAIGECELDGRAPLRIVVSVASQDGAEWKATFVGLTLYPRAVEFINGSWVMVGDGGSIHCSDDHGMTWIGVESGTINDLHGLSRGDDEVIAVGRNGTIMASRDGIDWETRSLSGRKKPKLLDIAWNGSTWAVLAESGAVYVSENGRDWERQAPIVNCCLRAVKCRGNEFWVIGNSGLVLRSSDGRHWKNETPELYLEVNSLGGAEEGPWVMVGERGLVVCCPQVVEIESIKEDEL